MTAPDPNAQNAQNVNNGDPLPGWARQQITDANSQAASQRVELQGVRTERDNLQGQLTTANTEKAEATTRADKAESELLRYKVALSAGIPGDRVESIVGRLSGATEAELKADADKLVKDFGINATPPSPPATDHSQGHGSEQQVTPNTPEAAFAQMWSNHFSQ